MEKPTTRYFATLEKGTPEVVELEPLGPGRFTARLRGKAHEVQAERLADGTLSVLLDGRSLEVNGTATGDPVQLTVDGLPWAIDVADERRVRLRSATHRGGGEGRQVIAAPMPGKVVRVLLQVGDAVQEGQGVVIVEAMKMENELKSPKSGKLVEISVKEGQTVEGGAPLAAVE